MAAALTYRTLFSLPPVIVLAGVTARAFLGRDRIMDLTGRALEGAGAGHVSVVGSVATVSAGPPAEGTLSSWILDLVSHALDMNLTALTWIGVGLLIYSGYALATQIEVSFDDITGRRRPRSFLKRLAAYWVALTAGPILIALGVLCGAWLWGAIESVAGTGAMIRVVRDFLVTGMALFWAYAVLPTVPLAWRANLTGAIVGAIILLSAKWAFSNAIIGIGAVNLLYGSAGAITLFMLWVYVMWLGALYGLQVASFLPKTASEPAPKNPHA